MEETSNGVHLQEKRRFVIKYRFVVVFLVFLGNFNLLTMRSNLAIVIVAMVNDTVSESNNVTNTDCPGQAYENTTEYAMSGDLSWSPYVQGIILGSFYYGYSISNLLSGRITELAGVKLSLGCGVLTTSVLTLLTPVVSRFSYIGLIVLRILMGFAEGPAYPAVNCLLGRWYHREERGLASAVMLSGLTVGPIVASIASGFLCASTTFGGWPSAFYVFGIIGIMWCIAWFLLMYDLPEDHPKISPEELNYIKEGQKEESPLLQGQRLPWKNLLTSVPVWASVAICFSYNWGYNFLQNDEPTFLNTILHIHISKNGVLSSLPPIAHTLFAIASGFITDKILAREWCSDTTIRKVLATLGCALSALCLIGVTLSGCHELIIIILFILCLGFTAFLQTSVTVAMVNISPMYTGTITGLGNGIGEMSGFLATYIVGALTDKQQSLKQWNIVLYITAAIYLITGIIFALFGSSQLQEWSKNGSDESAFNKKSKIFMTHL